MKAYRLLVTLSLVIVCEALLGLNREGYGVWDRSGGLSIQTYPFTRGQVSSSNWVDINPARGVFNFSALDAIANFAETQNQQFTATFSPIGGAPGTSMPPWIFDLGVPNITDGHYVYGYYPHPTFKVVFREMVQAFAAHMRTLPPQLQSRLAFVRCDTGATGDEVAYEEPEMIPTEYQLDVSQWRAHRLWVFEEFRSAFQDGPGPVIPLLFQNIELTGFLEEWNWVRMNVVGGFGAKYGGMVRGNHLTESQEVTDSFKASAVGSTAPFFSRNEMDQTWSKSYFQLNLKLQMYWTAIEQLHAGQAIWDVTGSCLENLLDTSDPLNNYTFVFDFFNKWAADVEPETAGGGFVVFHEGLDASDTDKFPEETYGQAVRSNEQRYLNICATYSSQGAQMDHVAGATLKQVAQRDTGLTGFNDAGWGIVPGNYDRFITQVLPDSSSYGVWRLGGPLSNSSHPYDRFGRRFDHATGRNTMYFDIHDLLLPSKDQPVQLKVIYRDTGKKNDRKNSRSITLEAKL
jgi:hypothetical protein